VLDCFAATVKLYSTFVQSFYFIFSGVTMKNGAVSRAPGKSKTNSDLVV